MDSRAWRSVIAGIESGRFWEQVRLSKFVVHHIGAECTQVLTFRIGGVRFREQVRLSKLVFHHRGTECTEVLGFRIPGVRFWEQVRFPDLVFWVYVVLSGHFGTPFLAFSNEKGARPGGGRLYREFLFPPLL